MEPEITPFGGWNRNLRLANDEVELLITLEVGPRILSYRSAAGGPNVFKVYEAQSGGTGEAEWQIRGGHRLWTAPEGPLSLVPDNGPVLYERTPHGVRLENEPTAPWGIRKVLEVELAAKGSGVTLRHRLINEGPEPVALASWGLSVMAPGGVLVIPQPPLGEHTDDLLPRRVIVPWTYTDLADPRLRFGTRHFSLRQCADAATCTKLGFYLPQPWAAYHNGDTLFVKTFEALADETYPDFGCNFETYTNAEMLEVESLGPLKTLAPGEATGHTETWALFSGIAAPASLADADLDAWLAPVRNSLSLP